MRLSTASRLSCATLSFLALSAGCGDSSADRREPDGAPGGTVVVASPAEADVLFPPLVMSIQGKQVVDLLFDHLAEIGDSLNTVGDAGFQPRLARGWEWASDSLSVTFRLDPRARWHDGVPVRAADVRFSFDVMRDPAVGSPHAVALDGVDSVTVRDSLTAVAWFARRTPEQFFSVAYNLAVLPSHLLAGVPRAELRASPFARRPVGSGRFRFARWDAGQRLELVADTANYRGRPRVDRVVWTVAPDPNAAAARVVTGEADFVEVVRGDAVRRAAEAPSVRLQPYGSLDYGYMVFNVRNVRDARGARVPNGSGAPRPHPLFADRAMRLAMSHAVDRAAAVRSALDSQATVALGPVTRAQSTADTTLRAPAFDPARAAGLLDSLGWRLPAGGGANAVRSRGGRALAFSLLVPSASATRMQLAVLLQAQLAAAGVRVDIDAVEPNVFGERMRAGAFDAALNVWRTDPSPATVRQPWGSPRGGPAGDAGANVGRYASAAFDALVDSASAALDPARGRAFYRRAYQTVLDDAPAVWLYEPRNLAAAHARLRLVGVRADAWWAGLADWAVPPNARIARDRLGLGERAVARR